MTLRNDVLEAGGAMPPATSLKARVLTAPVVQVWDPFVRIFHWSLVGLFVIAFVTGDETEWLHLI
jgi:hypothetical protein